MFLKGSELRRRIEVVFFVKMVMDTLMFLDRVYLTEFFRVSYTCSSDYSVYDGVYIHSLVARTFFCCTVCLRTSAHLHACAHTRMAQVSAKKVFAYVSFLSISPSPFSCLTHLLLSPYDSLSLDFPVHTFLPYLLVLKAQGMRTSARGREVWLSSHVRPQHRLWAQEVRQDHFCGQWHDAHWDLNEISDFSKNTHENIGLFGVLTMFESSVSHVPHDDFALQIENKESMHRETDC